MNEYIIFYAIYIMLYILQIQFLWICAVSLSLQNIENQQTLQYNILNYGEKITISLENYFNNPKNVNINKEHSINTDSLSLDFVREPIFSVSSLPLTAKLSNGSFINFNQLKTLQSRSIYDQPNKVFLMEQNIVFLVRYQFSSSKSSSSVEAFQINTTTSCTQVQLMQFNSSYYVIIECIKNSTYATLFPYKYNESSPGNLENLIQLPSEDIKIGTANNACNRSKMYGFQQLLLNSRYYYNSILFFCASTVRNTASQRLYLFSIIKVKGVEKLNYSQQLNTLQTITLAGCLRNSSFTGQYQKGVLTLGNSTLKYYSYGSGTGKCTNFMQIPGHRFIASVLERQIQYIYIIFNDKIIIKESYSPNFQVLAIREGYIRNMTLQSYAIARKFLSVLFEDNTHYEALVYDLTSVYPKLVNQIRYTKDNFSISLLSVYNFLENSNYFFTYNQVNNSLNLNYYQGYEFSIAIINPVTALPGAVIYLSTTLGENLILNISIRDFHDSTISKNENKDFIKTFYEILSINLSDYVIGPLGKFYNYPNSYSAFQYINYFTEISMTFMQRPIGVSINNVLNQPIINFYFGAFTQTCEMKFNISSKLTSVTDCKSSKKKKSLLENPREIIVLAQGKYLQFNSSIVQFCSLSTNNQFECMKLTINVIPTYDQIELISYFFINGANEIIELIIFNEDEIIFCSFQRNSYYDSAFNFSLYFKFSTTNMQQLPSMKIKQVFFDPGYHQFLVIHLQNSSTEHKIVIYDKPNMRKNSSKSFIGHVVQSLNIDNLQSVFCVENLLIVVFPSLTKQLWTIKEYKITKYFRIKEMRIYPLYDYNIIRNGRHYQNQNFVFIQVFNAEGRFYLVYSPMRQSFGVLSHKFEARGEQPIIFAQQIGEDNNNSMGINGNYLYGLTQPSLIFKFVSPASNVFDLSRYFFNVSVIDNNNVMNILTYEFLYNQGQQAIYYDDDNAVSIKFNENNRYGMFQIDPKRIKGPVNEFNIQFPDDDNCKFFSVDKTDIFTKKQCLLYSNVNKYGVMSDFIALTRFGVDIEVIVTDTSLFCIKKREFPAGFTPNFSNLLNCNFQSYGQDVIMSCDNITSLSKQIFNVTISFNEVYCMTEINEIYIPSWFNYRDYSIEFSGIYIILQVPIRYQKNMIYYKSQISDSRISENYSLLTLEGSQQQYQSEFSTIDTSISENIFLILEDGIRIYNLSDSKSAIGPALWIPKKDIQELFVIGIDQQFVYIKFLSMQADGDYFIITIEFATEKSTFDMEITVAYIESATTGQTVYAIIDKKIVYQYLQYMNCFNSLQSQSQNFNSIIIKICSYQPPSFYVFANFISIGNQTSKFLIQFYNKSGTYSYPFRMDAIYSNFYSHDSFIIRDNTLIVGSLFNLLCYYELAMTVKWQFSYIDQPQNTKNQSNDRSCTGILNISNLQYNKYLGMEVVYDDEEYDDEYWSKGSFYIQRIILLLILLNTVRLLIKKKKDGRKLLVRKKISRQNSNKFEVMVKINSKKSI